MEVTSSELKYLLSEGGGGVLGNEQPSKFYGAKVKYTSSLHIVLEAQRAAEKKLPDLLRGVCTVPRTPRRQLI